MNKLAIEHHQEQHCTYSMRPTRELVNLQPRSDLCIVDATRGVSRRRRLGGTSTR